jgi:sec-independent protein translocase protein TatC
MAENKMPFIYHLHELRRRLFYCVLSLLISGGIAYAIQPKLLAILVKPLGQKLYYANPAGGFSFYFNICMLFAVLVTLPLFIYNIVRFIQPALGKYTQIHISLIMLSSVVLAASGVAFAYFFSLPAALHFLMTFGNGKVAPLIFANEYLNFVIVYLLSFAVLFQIPVIVSFVDKIKPLSPGGMMKLQRWIILGGFIVAAILTPTPDPLNQIIMASPMVVLYQFSIIYVWWYNSRMRKSASLPAPVMEIPEEAVLAVPAVSPIRVEPLVQTVQEPSAKWEEPATTAPTVPVPKPRPVRSMDGVVLQTRAHDYQDASRRPVVQQAPRPIRRAVIDDIKPMRRTDGFGLGSFSPDAA